MLACRLSSECSKGQPEIDLSGERQPKVQGHQLCTACIEIEDRGVFCGNSRRLPVEHLVRCGAGAAVERPSRPAHRTNRRLAGPAARCRPWSVPMAAAHPRAGTTCRESSVPSESRASPTRRGAPGRLALPRRAPPSSVIVAAAELEEVTDEVSLLLTRRGVPRGEIAGSAMA